MSLLDSSPDLQVRTIAGALGAELRGVDLELLDDAGYQSLRTALREHHVVFLPEQHLSPDAHRDLGRRFGELEVHPYISKLDDEHPEICVLNSDQGFIADVWHTDVTFADSPPQFSILNMREVPATGGDTMWTNQGLVYASLSEPIKALLLGLTAVHTAAVFGHPEQRAEHPVVRRHPETGAPSLFVNRQFTSHITQLSRAESAALLAFLYAFSEQPFFTCRYSWTPGTIAIWDNRITQHYVVNDFTGTRVLNRVTVLGDKVEPYADVMQWPAYEARNVSAANSGGTV
ncbi:MAG TPA: TauD/TfdA family dioxygenase [Frankiaceae bacterium]|jgi:taurine dioxygenase|nr:TauD/TfdA family dioxygenase [Frankiaceae bacterium]